ncbi:MAG: EFR1 family ferrodoxin [Methanobacterium sp.]|nr:EFR1 family ferrodoxin [Methanobacterium sp.]
MSTEIYYFSGTGNSLAVARDIAEKTSGKLISIASLMDKETLKTDADVIGIVFPIYYAPYGGVPLIVRRFINKLENINSKYIFAICTYGSGPFNSLKFVDKLIESRGGKLAAGFMVNMPNNMARSTINSKQKQQKMFHVWKENMETVYKHINVRKEGKFDLPNIIVGKAFILIKIIFTPLMFLFKPLTLNSLKRYSSSSSRSYEEILPLMDNSFYTDENCIGCSNCSRICPVKNIKIVDGKAEWQHHCEFCLTCFHWCREGAIKSSELTKTVRYHHPDVKLLDMLRQIDG